MDAFGADVLIYAATPGHPLGTRVAVHLATAVNAGADRFITDNAKDFKRDVKEIDVTYPDDLPGPG